MVLGYRSCPQAKKKSELQLKIRMNQASCTNGTFGFFPTRQPMQKKPKELFFAHARTNLRKTSMIIEKMKLS
jgi:hypothetical protein